MHTGCWTASKILVGTAGWWPSGEQSITQMASQRRRRYSRIRWKPGPSRNPATLMKQTTPRSAAGWWSKTFHVAQRQK